MDHSMVQLQKFLLPGKGLGFELKDSHFSNPDQSKHLETARMHLFDIWIDFVNLRSEDYTENSRIPTMVHAYFIY
ncbi:unnamed protein product [Ilex paraguariensis]|uniref:Uncharacterized protein n=1 Tax=Ilex paraguariensis TaxID=185542 RepID=A0ABC8TJA5_9AQUA